MMSRKDFIEKQFIFVFLNEGEKFSFKNDNIVIRDKENKIKHQSSCYLLFALFIAGHLSVTSGLLQRARRFGFSIVLLTHSLKTYGIFSAGAEGNVLLRKRQYDYNRWDIGATLISNKIINQSSVLKKIRKKPEEVKKAIALLDGYAEAVLDEKWGLNEIMGIEGSASRVYFSALFYHYEWKSRMPRVKPDMINALLDIGYSILFNIINALLEVYGFDTYAGVLHRQFFQRKSLTCDLVEPFRCLIDDALIKALNLGQCREEDFSVIQNRYFLFGKKSAPYVQIFLKSILDRKNEIFIFIRSYYRLFMKGAKGKDFPFFWF